MKHIIALAALAAMGFAGAAYAGSATPPKAMSDSEMDKVTAGQGLGIQTAAANGGFSANNNARDNIEIAAEKLQRPIAGGTRTATFSPGGGKP